MYPYKAYKNGVVLNQIERVPITHITGILKLSPAIQEDMTEKVADMLSKDGNDHLMYVIDVCAQSICVRAHFKVFEVDTYFILGVCGRFLMMVTVMLPWIWLGTGLLLLVAAQINSSRRSANMSSQTMFLVHQQVTTAQRQMIWT